MKSAPYSQSNNWVLNMVLMFRNILGMFSSSIHLHSTIIMLNMQEI